MSRFRDRAIAAQSITAFGDSVTAGASVDEADRWANRFAAAHDLALTNKGISGTVLQNSPDASGKPRADNGYDRFEADLLGDDRSELLAIMYGANDARYTAAPDTLNLQGFERDYHHMLERILEAGYAATDICIGSPLYITDTGFTVGEDCFTGQSRAGYQSFVDAAKRVAEKFKTYYAAVNEATGANKGFDLILPDKIHPNPAGHSVIAAAFANATLL